MTTSPIPFRCTVGPSAVTGALCGARAVTYFKTVDGAVYAECADHAAGDAAHDRTPRRGW